MPNKTGSLHSQVPPVLIASVPLPSPSYLHILGALAAWVVRSLSSFSRSENAGDNPRNTEFAFLS